MGRAAPIRALPEDGLSLSPFCAAVEERPPLLSTSPIARSLPIWEDRKHVAVVDSVVADGDAHKLTDDAMARARG